MGLKKYKEEDKVDYSQTELEQLGSEVVEEEDEEEETKPIKISEDEKEVAKKVNEARTLYVAEATKQKKINYVITAVMCAILIGAIILVWNQKSEQWVVWVGLAIMGVCLVGSYILTQRMKKKLTAKVNEYLKVLFEETSNFVYGNENNKNFVIDGLKKLELEEFAPSHFYKGIKNVRSRNVVTFEQGKNKYLACDLAANILVKGRLAPRFLGKFHSVEFDGEYKYTTVLQLKGKELSVPIDDIEGLNLIKDNETYILYSSDDKANKLINAKLLSAIMKIKISAPVIDVIFSISGNKIFVGIDYNDAFITIPVDKEFDTTFTRKAKEDFAEVLNIVEIAISNLNSQNKE